MKNKFITAVQVLVLSLAIFSCKKKEEVSLKSQLIEKLPSSTFAFFNLNARSKSFQDFENKYALSSPLSMLNKLDSKNMKQFFEIAQKTGFIRTTVNQALVFNEVLAFAIKPQVAATNTSAPNEVDAVTANLPEIGLFLAAANNTNMKDKLGVVVNEFKNQNFIIENISQTENQTFDLYKLKLETNVYSNIFLAASKDFLAISSNPELTKSIFLEQEQTGLKELQSNPSYTKILNNIGSSAQQYAYGYLEISNMLPLVQEFAKNNPQASNLEQFPIDAIGYGAETTDLNKQTVVVSLKLKNDDQKRWFSTLSASNSVNLQRLAPKQSVMAISIDGQTLGKLKQTLMSEVDATKQTILQAKLVALDHIRRMHISLRTAQSASPFPELGIAIESTDGELVKNQIIQILKESIQATGMASPWQETEIADVKYQYTSSPFGIGAYVGANGNTVLISSSIGLAKEMLAAVRDGNSDSLGKVINDSLKLALTKDSVVSFYTNSEEIYNLAQSLQGSLAMFSGASAAGSNQSDLEYLKNFGPSITNVQYNDAALIIETLTQPK